MIKRKGKIEPPLYDIEKIQHDNPNPVFGTTGSVLTRDTPLVHFREQNAPSTVFYTRSPSRRASRSTVTQARRVEGSKGRSGRLMVGTPTGGHCPNVGNFRQALRDCLMETLSLGRCCLGPRMHPDVTGSGRMSSPSL